MWLLDYGPEVRSDFSVFHRVDDPMQLDSPRYFELAVLLPAYDGALRRALIRDHAPAPHSTGGAVPAGPHMPAGAQVVDDVRAVAAMTNDDPRFPGIEYAGG